MSLAPSFIFLTPSPLTIHLGDAITISGFISPVHSYRSVSLYYSQDGYEWSLLATVVTDSGGQFSYQWTPVSVGTLYLKAEWSGDSDHQGAVSEICTVTISQAPSSITMALSSSSINLGETIVLSGEISPSHSYVNVDIYVSRDGYQWNFLASILTDAHGRYIYHWSSTASGTYYFKACWSGDADHTGGESNVSTLQVNYSPPTNPDDQGTPNPTPPNNQSPEIFTPNGIFIILATSIAAIGICLLIILRKRGYH